MQQEIGGGAVSKSVVVENDNQACVTKQYTFEAFLRDPQGWAECQGERAEAFFAGAEPVQEHAEPPPPSVSPPLHPPRPSWMYELAPLPASELQEKKTEEPKKKGDVIRTVPFDIQRMRMFKKATPAAKKVLRMLYSISKLTKGRDGYYHRYVNAGVNGLAALTGLSAPSVKRALAYWREKRVIWLLHRGRPQTKGKHKCSRYELPRGRKQWAAWNVLAKTKPKTDIL